MNYSCSGLLPSIELGLCILFEKVEKRRITSFLFKNKHSQCRRVYPALAALVKTAQQSGNCIGKVAFHH